MRCKLQATVMSVFLLLAGSFANAADQGITGQTLLLKSPGKFVLLSKDASISIAGSDPVGGADSSLTFDDGSGPVTFSLPSAGWRSNGSGTLFKYKNSSAPGGPSPVKIAKLKSGLLRVVGKGLPFAVPNGPASIDLVLSLDGGTNTYCMTFTGTGDGSKFLVKDATAGSCAPPAPTPTATPTATPPAPCSGAFVGGFCWFVGNHGQSCDAVCAGMDLTCSAGTTTYAGSEGTLANCIAVMDTFFSFPVVTGDVDLDGGFGCFVTSFSLSPIQIYRDVSPTTCASGGPYGFRACACQ